jgi:O-antigen/teichoic acid export membrane protein
MTALRQTVRQCWDIGGFSLISNLMSAMRLQVFPWALAYIGGTILAAQFQAALNLVMAVNPVLLGLCNVIPQAAARGRQQGGTAQAWNAARGYILLGAIPIFAYYALLLAWPGGVLTLLYGAASPYVGLTFAVRAMAAAALIAYSAEMVCSYLHGLESAKLAMKINMYGLAASVLLGLPSTLVWGLTGSCIGLLAASVVRSILAAQTLAPMLAENTGRLSPAADHR